MTATAAEPEYIHLRAHSVYSLLEGAIPVKRLPELCRDHALPALGLADRGNLFGALEFSEAMAKAGVQPIVGCRLLLDAEAWSDGEAGAERRRDAGPEPAPLVLFAQSEQGYLNLMKLTSVGFLESVGAAPKIGWETLAAHAGGLIALTGGAEGPAAQLIRRRGEDAAGAHLERLAALFPDRLYVELQRQGGYGATRTGPEAASEAGLLSLALALDLPIVATNEIFFETPEMHGAHDAMLCIADGRYVSEEDRRQVTPNCCFRAPAEMTALFSDLPEALENTVEIARRCAYRPLKRPPILPKFADDEVAELRAQAQAGLERRLSEIEPAAPREAYDERLELELSVIERMGFPGYFLIVADFIQWAKAQNIPVGPGRGSGAGSLVAYVLTITNLDPLRYNLLFERFLNPERVSMPDFDIDFCQDRREEVIRYVQDKYGHDKVAQIITFGAMLSKAAVRDVGRVLQLSYGQVDRLAKLIPVEGVKPVSVAKAVAEEPLLQEEARKEPVVAELLGVAEKIEGVFRNASTHAAGVVIGDRPLDELTPLYRDPRSDMPVTQFNMKWVEQAGLVKFDFLGLKTLTVIQNAVDLLAAKDVAVDIDRIPLDDEKTYALYSRAETVAVFQVESSGMRDALRQLQPSCLEDIIALVALYRPGPMENIPKYCNVKHEREQPDYLHPMLEPILKETQGIIVYQEQVMQIAQFMAGYSLGGADLLRRAMGKKIKEAMDAERPKFLEGAKKNNVDTAKAKEVWDLLEKFANYGFNKSHAAAYALVSYQTAWLKANHPVAFMAAAMNLDMQNTDKLGLYRQELDRMGAALAPPDVNASDVTFSLEADPDAGAEASEPTGAAGRDRVRYALGAVKNVGREGVAAIVSARREGGPFKDLFDFARRVSLKSVGKRSLENLARAGALDSLEPNRRRALDAVDTLVAYSAVVEEEGQSAQDSLFGAVGVDVAPPKLPKSPDFTPADRLAEEAAAIGFYISGHPLDDYQTALKRKRIQSYAEIAQSVGAGLSTRLAAVVLGKQERKSQKGSKFAFVQLSDPTGVFEGVAFSEALIANRDLFTAGSLVVLAVDAEKDGDQVKLRIQGAQAIDDAVAGAGGGGFRVFVNDSEAVARVCSALERQRSAAGARGSGSINLLIAPTDAGWEAELALPGAFPVSPQIKGMLRATPGVAHVDEV